MNAKSFLDLCSSLLILTLVTVSCAPATTSLPPSATIAPSETLIQSTSTSTPVPTASRSPLPTATLSAPITLNLVGDWPGGTDAAHEEFSLVYPYLVKYLGEPLSQPDSLTWILDPNVQNRGDIGWDAQRDAVIVGPLPDLLRPPQFPGLPRYWDLYQQFEHETSHLFLDVGDDVINFTFGQWIWEGHALIGQDLAHSEIFHSNRALALTYDTTANLGWESINGVLRDGEKYNRSIVDLHATAALRLMTEALSYDTGLDYMSRVNAALLAEYQKTNDRNITPEQYKAVLNAAAGERMMDGLPPGDWLFTQPIANVDGALGPHLIVEPFYSVPQEQVHLRPTGLTVTVFDRQAGPQPGEKRELGIANLEITINMINAAGEVIKSGAGITDGSGVARVDIFSDGSPLDVRQLPLGAYLFKVQTSYLGRVLEASNFFVSLDTFVTPIDNRIFIVPMNADGSSLRPELVDQLTVSNGQIQDTMDGVLVVTAEPGASIEFSIGDFKAVVSKPVTGRLVPLRIP